ncbi:uncharacterized protein LOC120351888 [Nilaparvata lugens]|uniref:uncharacterized protein LOC120351888 n=1 Tax=Nilaparvata lugens TaxID=108931 RepID=UPI00193E9BAE|nr:uncharacterized protein LOC120351888 [Nilaparvata lugens]
MYSLQLTQIHYSLSIQFEITAVQFELSSLLTRMKERFIMDSKIKRLRSERTSLFCELELEGSSYISEQEDFALIKWLFKARTELIQLNRYTFNQPVKLCSL